ncbi:Peptidoglycan/LPS O-acetylase OafA/YrhL, contains acyltransferase and SGNH-hydrolase domains [Duganella sacchari]|uniref:Peptidoglycan/LPS O-acetylase OafA/YrhL, contains acyltransferase and SGNH-hydrolase domains n=1 Tax=Duganella sacchari TaxID=551987 RepID=A0A1M7QJG8_9BURK|nr:acyltransferase [Duganella sacchari]SHN31349.1 Peptidoglycan/LPS O-acetylase OafA/YrhL, contains acyltransferase and SGNH-hydrolase domains [Duganella sacchari]
MTNNAAPVGFTDTKQHYAILDGLRGVAALMVVAFHLFEAHTASRFEQIINHGYLAVDFFFVLSGFVIGYAYDDRWRTMSTMEFFKRRLIRLHPMIVVAMLIGAALFYVQASAAFPNIQATPAWLMLTVMVIGMTLIPVGAALDIRGWSEMHPLNGPSWSLFYEYVANILYALFVRKFSKTVLACFVFVTGCVLVHYCLTGPNGDVIGGWSLEPVQMRIGLTRLLYPFFAGLLLSRIVTVGRIRHAFLLSSVIIIAALAWPRLGGPADLWKNGLYDALCIALVFPLVVYIGASGSVNTRMGARICGFLGAISYPIYIIHYPFVYTYIAWVNQRKIPLADALPMTIATFLACVTTAYLCLTFYDIPVRRWLSKRYVH